MGWRLGAGPWRLKTCGKCSSPPRSPSNVIILCVEDKTQVCVCVVCSSYSSFAPSPPFFSSRWQKDLLHLHILLFSKVLYWSRRVSPRRPMYLLIAGSDYCVMRFAYACMRRQNLVLLSCLSRDTEPCELAIEIVFYDDDCFYYHSWRNNVVIAFGTLSSFLT